MAEGGHRCVYVPRERRATPFRGDGSDLIDAEEWASDITRFATARGMTGLDGAEYALANLEGLARREILSLPASDITSAQEICDAIVTAFGERRSAAQLRDALHARRQATSETIREFGHFRRECTQLENEQSLEQPMTNRYSGNDRPPL